MRKTPANDYCSALFVGKHLDEPFTIGKEHQTQQWPDRYSGDPLVVAGTNLAGMLSH